MVKKGALLVSMVSTLGCGPGFLILPPIILFRIYHFNCSELVKLSLSFQKGELIIALVVLPGDKGFGQV